MANFNPIILTRRGRELDAKVNAGFTKMQFTKVATNDVVYNATEINDLITFPDVKQEALISGVDIINEVAVKVQAVLTNNDLLEGYYVRSIAQYAMDPDLGEILYSVTSVAAADQADWMPAFNGLSSSSILLNLINTMTSSENVELTVVPAAAATVGQLMAIQQAVQEFENKTIYSEEGVHGLRYFDDKLQVKNGEEWVDVETGGGGGGIAPNNVSDLKLKVGNTKLTLFWSDPEDTIVEGQVLCTWKGTKLVQKAGSFPENPKDGTVLLDNQVRDTYKTNGFEINGLTNGTTYYFALFPYSDQGAVNMNPVNRVSGAPQPYRKMTVRIDLSNSNPSTCITYADDAVGMTPGSEDWDDFFGHYPCLLKNGVEVGRLKKNNFDQFEDGSSADITSGNAGDAMIAFPRRGLTIKTTGNILEVSMTDDPDNAEFEYNAHQRGSTRKEVFYLGVYKSSNVSSKMRSLKDKAIQANQTIGTFRTQAHNNGAGYENSGFFQLTFRQAMYLLKYRNLNSQTAVGRGYVDGNSSAINTGGTETKGMDWGETTGKQHMKLFGLEDFWGNIWEWIDGIVTTSSRNMLVASDNFNDAGTGYADQGVGAGSNIGNYMSKPQGTTKTGFLAKEVSGSETTYFCDDAYLYASCVARFGGRWAYASAAGAFFLHVYSAASYSAAYIAGRLMFL